MTQRIMVIEDDHNLNELFVRFLEKADFQVQSAENGRDALDIIEDTIPDLLVLDMNLPEVSGSEIVEYVRANAHLEHIKILVVSSTDTAPDEDIDHLVDMRLTKPVHKQQLIDCVGSLVGA